jgi:hypothetical protein
MSLAAQQKRLDEIEIQLTPKDWAIRLADEFQKYNSNVDRLRAMLKCSFDDLPMVKPYRKLRAQAEQNYPGHSPEAIRARASLADALCREYHTLQLLLRIVNEAMRDKFKQSGMEAALRFSELHALIFQDATGRMVANAAAWIVRQTPADEADAKQRAALLNELAVFTDAGLVDMPFEMTAFLPFPSPLAQWRHDTVAFLKDLFAHRAAVQRIQVEHLDRHSILYPELQADIAKITHEIQSAVATFNNYVSSRPGEDSDDSKSPIDLAGIESSAHGQWAADVVALWLREAKDEALENDRVRWASLREEWMCEVEGGLRTPENKDKAEFDCRRSERSTVPPCTSGMRALMNRRRSG